MHASFCQALFSTNFNLFCAYNIWRFHVLHGTISCFETCSCAVLLSYAGARDSIIRLTFFPRQQDRRQKDRAVLPGKEAAQHEQSHGGQHRPGQQREVTYYHLIAKDTVDEQVYACLLYTSPSPRD